MTRAAWSLISRLTGIRSYGLPDRAATVRSLEVMVSLKDDADIVISPLI